LSIPVDDAWEEQVKEQHRVSRQQTIQSIADGYRMRSLDQKLTDFSTIGPAVSSIIAHHNVLLRQVRSAFVGGQYYPALTGACALGERILNHLVIELREEFRATPEYKKVHGKDSFDDWGKAIRVLNAWAILQPEAARAFEELGRLPHRSLHFNADTVVRLRDEALRAIGYPTRQRPRLLLSTLRAPSPAIRRSRST
jgi:hypothetical protein